MIRVYDRQEYMQTTQIQKAQGDYLAGYWCDLRHWWLEPAQVCSQRLTIMCVNTQLLITIPHTEEEVDGLLLPGPQRQHWNRANRQAKKQCSEPPQTKTPITPNRKFSLQTTPKFTIVSAVTWSQKTEKHQFHNIQGKAVPNSFPQ